MSAAARPGRRDALWTFYDGECALCSSWIRWAVRRDRSSLLRPVAARTPTARRILGPERIGRVLAELHAWSPAEGVLTGPAALAAVLRRLPRWRILGAALALPPVLALARPVYRSVAARRHRIAAACSRPEPRPPVTPGPA